MSGRPRSRNRTVDPTVLGMMIAAVLVPLNSTMIAVALPEISSDLGVSTGTSGVLVVVYLLVMLVGQPAGGRLGDSIGYRRAVVIGLAGVALTSLVAALAGAFAVLVAIRAAQAVFAALLIPNVQAMIRVTTPEDRVGRVFGLFGSMIGAGAAIGPLVGGSVTGLAGWPAVFLVNIPVVAISFTLIRNAGEPVRRDDEQTDLGPLREQRVWNRVFTGAFSTQALTTFGQYTLILVVPVLLDERGWSAGGIGLVVTALTIGMVVTGPVGGTFGDRHGRRLPAAVGVAAAFVAMAAAALAGVSIHAAVLVVVLTGYGFGFGFAAPNLMTAAIESAPEDRTATAGGLFSMGRYTGSIPASTLFALTVGPGTSGVDTLLVMAASCGAAATITTVLLPTTTGRPAAPAPG